MKQSRSTFEHLSVTSESSRGRQFPEKPHPYRCDFERDRDRVIHCAAFRRLEGKTQVFTPGLDDHYRTRLTHSIEVAQIGRTLARALGFNEPLTEAICLSHDLGHAPFGHAGETALAKLMADYGGFEHNRQSLRIVDLLEHPYPDFFGLNLMFETRLALARHRSPYDCPAADEFPQANCSLEGQVANLADRIAYNAHDLEDGLRARLLKSEELGEIELFRLAEERVNAPQLPDRIIRRTRTAKAIIDILVGDAIEATTQILSSSSLQCLDDVLNTSQPLVVLSAEAEARLRPLESFLLERFYHNEPIVAAAKQASGDLRELFDRFCDDPSPMPRYFQRFIDEYGLQRTVCDYIAGMTDRFCLSLLGRV